MNIHQYKSSEERLREFKERKRQFLPEAFFSLGIGIILIFLLSLMLKQ
jgi:hypothetical protein